MFFFESNFLIDISKILLFFDQKKWDKDWKFIVKQSIHKKVEWYFRNKEAKLVEIKQLIEEE